jgi:glycosyltransferase involved in cell wall biosynthesis
MFGWEFPPYVAGGLATATLGLVKGLLQCGVDVTLVVPFRSDTPFAASGFHLVHAPDVAVRAADRLRIRHVPSALIPYGTAESYAQMMEQLARSPLLSAGQSPSHVYGGDLYAEVERFAAVAECIADEEPHDVIDCHDWMTYAAGIRAHEISGRPLVTHIHATEFDRSIGGANPAIVEREWTGLHAAARVVSNSAMLKRRVMREYDVPADRIDVIHWGVEWEPASIGAHEGDPFGGAGPVVLFLGRVTHQKGPRYFVETARRVSDFLPDARFIVAGDGDQLPDTMMRAAELGIADRIFFTGGLSGLDVDRAFQLADVCVMPSVSEPYGIVALESLRNGTPCIVPRDSGVAEVLSNVIKVDFWDVDEMTNQIVALARYPALHAELRARGLAELSLPRFTLREPARLTLAVYRRATLDAA